MPYKVKVDRTMCIGSASCVAVAPKTFALDKEGKSTVKKKNGTMSTGFVSFSDIEDKPKNIVNATKACPVNAITVVEVDDQGNEIRQIWPA